MQDTKRQTWIIVSVVAVLLLGGTAVGFLIVPRMMRSDRGAASAAADPAADPNKPNEYIASAEFENKPVLEQMKYFQEHREQIDHEQARRLWGQRMRKTVDEWYALPEDQRVAYLDGLIDDWEQARDYWRQRREREEQEAERSDGQEEGKSDEGSDHQERRDRGPRGERDRGQVRQHIRERTETTSPEDRAKQMAFFSAMMKRRTERGLPGWGGPGGGPRGGRGGPRGR
jgi:flagellar biosynthesis/type III secretory pathway M-ring protein FliF/YscJ